MCIGLVRFVGLSAGVFVCGVGAQRQHIERHIQKEKPCRSHHPSHALHQAAASWFTTDLGAAKRTRSRRGQNEWEHPSEPPAASCRPCANNCLGPTRCVCPARRKEESHRLHSAITSPRCQKVAQTMTATCGRCAMPATTSSRRRRLRAGAADTSRGGGDEKSRGPAPETDLLAIFSRAQVFDPGGTPSTHKAGQNFRQ